MAAGEWESTSTWTVRGRSVAISKITRPGRGSLGSREPIVQLEQHRFEVRVDSVEIPMVTEDVLRLLGAVEAQDDAGAWAELEAARAKARAAEDQIRGS